MLQSTIIMIKDTTKKTRCPKKYALTESELANLAQCSVSYVKKIREGKCEINSALAKRVVAIDEIAETNKDLLISEIERIINQ